MPDPKNSVRSAMQRLADDLTTMVTCLVAVLVWSYFTSITVGGITQAALILLASSCFIRMFARPAISEESNA
jgi:hypothetical protein